MTAEPWEVQFTNLSPFTVEQAEDLLAAVVEVDADVAHVCVKLTKVELWRLYLAAIRP